MIRPLHNLRNVIGISICAAIPFAACSETLQCRSTQYSVYCQSQTSLVDAWQYAQTAFDMRAGGFTNELLENIHSLGCSYVEPERKLILKSVKDFKLKNGVAKLAYVNFEVPLSHKVDKYLPNGEYAGKAVVTDRSGWILKREVSCD